MNIRLFAIVLSACLLMLAGCKAPAPVDGPTTQCLTADQPRVMAAARDVVTKMGFRLDKYDIEQGILTTRPLSGSQFFEVWRSDNANFYEASEASIHSLQRVIEMKFAVSGDKTCVQCDARVRRLSLPEKEIVGTTGAYSMFTKSSTSLMQTRLNPGQAQKMSWIDMGIDGPLADKILSKLDGDLSEGKGR